MTPEGDNRLTVALIGFGEAAGAFVAGWNGGAPARFRAYDIKTDGDGAVREGKLADYAAAGVEGCATPAEAVARADAVFSLVTADQSVAAARSVAGVLDGPALYFDCNSCAPGTKREAAEIVEGGGGRYVDVAVMAPVGPKLHRTPLLVSGPHAAEALKVMEMLEMAAVEAPGAVGTASAIKLCRSIMVKGLEALSAELLLAAHTLGVAEPVLASLEASDPNFGWTKRTAYSLERMMVHGERRAAEMAEAAAMVEALGLPGDMARATVDWQRRIGELRLPGDREAVERNVEALLVRLRDPT